MHQVSESLKYIFQLIGLKNLPNAEGIAVLVEFLVSEYGYLTLSEIKLAFKLAAAGKLDCDITHYQNLSAPYMAQVLNAYKRIAGEIRQDNEKAIRIPQQIEYKPENEAETLEFWKNEWAASEKKDFRLFGGFVTCYKILTKNKEIDLTEEEKETIRKRAAKALLNSANGTRESIEVSKKIKEHGYLDIFCKKLAVADYFNKQLSMDNF